METKMYRHTVQGEAVVGSKNNKERKEYTTEFVLPLKGGEALSVIQNKMIRPHLKKTEPDFNHVRLCRIVATIEDKKAKPLQVADLGKMTLEQMIQFSAEQNLASDVSRMGLESARLTIVNDLQKKKKQAKAQLPKAGGKGPGKASAKGQAAAAEADDDVEEFGSL